MGQYYNIVFGNKNGKKINVFNRRVNGDYTMAKLMEHSWWLNDCMSCASEYLLLNGPLRLAWVGDYAEQDDFENDFKSKRKIADNVAVPNLEMVWGENAKEEEFTHEYKIENGEKVLVNPVLLDEYYLVNHDQKLYLNCKEFHQKASELANWIIHPLSILTAVGNGRGGGDYYPNNEKEEALVGSWAWNLLSLEGEIPKGYKKADIMFYEK